MVADGTDCDIAMVIKQNRPVIEKFSIITKEIFSNYIKKYLVFVAVSF